MTDGEPERAKEKQRCEPDSEAPEAILPFPVSGKDDKHSSDKITAGFWFMNCLQSPNTKKYKKLKTRQQLAS